jgi:hypothetical protein
MAITTTTISKAAGWASTDVIYQLEEAFTWLGWHGSRISGIVTGFQWSGGGDINTSAYYEEVYPSTTSGIGTGASFYIARNIGGTISEIYVNRSGVGYTNGEYITLSAADIGGSGNGAVAIGITVFVDGGASPVGYGTTNAFFDKDVTAGSTYPWGVLKLDVDSNKKFGTTYRGMQVNGTTIYVKNGSGFVPSNTSIQGNGGNYLGDRFAGVSGLDVGTQEIAINSRYVNNGLIGYSQSGFTFASSNSYQLDLNVFKSSIDPNFAVLSYKHPTLSSTNLSGNTYQTFIIHNFTSSLYDLDQLFLGGTTYISPSGTSLLFSTHVNGSNTDTIRTAEFGHINDSSVGIKYATYTSSAYPTSNTEFNFTPYFRGSSNSTGKGQFGQGTLSSNVYFNAVIKGIPLNPILVPSPYYIPDDFVLIDFEYNIPNANIQQGDTITISGSEVYTVITGSYNQTTTTRGLLFCARTV